MRYRELKIAALVTTLIAVEFAAVLSVTLWRDYSGSHPLSEEALLECALGAVILIGVALLGIVFSMVLLFKVQEFKRLSFLSVTLNALLVVMCLTLIYIYRPWEHKAEQIEITESGLFEIHGSLEELEDYVNTSTSDTIPAILGGRFGFKYVLHGRPKGATLDLRKVTTFPSPGLWDSTKHCYRMESITPLPSVVGDSGYSGYRFDIPNELLQGTWTMRVWYAEKLLSERSFYVKHPKDSVLIQ